MKIKKSKGFTLVELGVVLALVGIMMFFAISKMKATSDESKAQSLTGDLSQITLNVKRLYSTQNDFTGITIAALRDNSVFPSQWNVASVITGPFSGPVLVAPDTLASANDAATITIPNIPTAVCSTVVRTLASGMQKISVGATVVMNYNGALDVPALGASCAAASAVPVSLTFFKM